MKKITKILSIMAAFVLTMMLCCAVPASALTDGDWEFQLLDNEVTITAYLGTDTDIVMPETIYGTPVTNIKAYGIFPNEVKKAMTSVTIPATVKTISDATFEGCGNLKTVRLSDGLESIGKYAFRGCTSLERVQLPGTLKTIAISAFENCTSLKEMNFPASLERIDAMHAYQTFANTALEHIDLSQTSATLGEAVFKNCKKLKTVKLNENMKTISKYMFDGCESLEKVEIPGGVKEIGGYAFSGCASLKNIVLPVSLKKIDEFSAFAGCTSLREVVIPYGTTNIASYTFRDCTNLKAVYIPDTVKHIGFDITGNCPEAIVYCSAGSSAAEICKKQSISYLTDNSVNTGIHVFYNGNRISFHSYAQNPEILEGRTLVPLRSIFEAMGAEIEWDGATSTATATRKGVEVKIQIGASEMYKNGKAVSLDVPAQLMNDRTMVPVRVIAEAFGADVEWNGNGRMVFITE